MEIAELKDTASLLPYFLKHKNVWADYDEQADVLYLHFRKPNIADHSELTDDDVIIRYANSEVIGLTFLNASKKIK